MKYQASDISFHVMKHGESITNSTQNLNQGHSMENMQSKLTQIKTSIQWGKE